MEYYSERSTLGIFTDEDDTYETMVTINGDKDDDSDSACWS